MLFDSDRKELSSNYLGIQCNHKYVGSSSNQHNLVSPTFRSSLLHAGGTAPIFPLGVSSFGYLDRAIVDHDYQSFNRRVVFWSEGGKAKRERWIEMRTDVLSPPHLLPWSTIVCTDRLRSFSRIESPLY